MDQQTGFVGRKCFMAYVRAALATCLGVLVFGAATTAAALAGYPRLALAGVAVCGLVVVKGLYNLAWLRSVRWTVGEEGVLIEWGLLPWAKYHFDHPYDTIFEAYYTYGFFAKLGNYGTCVIRRTEGVTSAETETHMRDAVRIVRAINARVKELRKARHRPVVIDASAGSEVSELADLARLKANGDISAEEYETMKARIVGVH